MILDITLNSESLILKIHEKLFTNKSFPLSHLNPDTPFMNQYSDLGKFEINNPNFGFDGCFKFQEKNDKYSTYSFELPINNQFTAFRQMIMTVYIITYYVIEQMFFEKEYFNDGIWDDQTLTFVILNGGRERCGYSIGGQIYPRFQKSLQLLDEDGLLELNNYVASELNRFYNYFFHKDIEYPQVSIKNRSLFVQVTSGGRWISWEASTNPNKPSAFDSHNMDHASDQILCFVAVVAMNTWLRNN